MTLPNGHYRTKAGSTVKLSGTHGGVSHVTFDWFEELNACIECQVDAYPRDWGDGEWRLTWQCEYCDGGSAELQPDHSAGDET